MIDFIYVDWSWLYWVFLERRVEVLKLLGFFYRGLGMIRVVMFNIDFVLGIICNIYV